MSKLKLRSSGPGRLLCFDLENRPLAYWYDGQTTSEITAFGWKWSDETDVHTLLLKPNGSYQYDGRTTFGYVDAHKKFHGILAEADVVFGHNIRRHDLPILQAWTLRLELPSIEPVMTTDTLKDYPRRKDLSASLENLAAMYGLQGDKYVMSQPMWEAANRLTRDGVELARKRVASDVLLQESLRSRLLELGLLAPPRLWRP